MIRPNCIRFFYLTGVRKMKTTLFVFVSLFSLGLISKADAALIGYWNFDEKSGTIAHDSSSNGYDGTVNGGADWTTGKVGNALTFNGNGNYVNIPGSENVDISSGITIEAWVKFNDITPDPFAAHTIAAKWGVGDRAFYLGQGGNNDKFEYDLWANGDAWIVGPVSSLYSNTAPVAGVWTHVAATYDGSIANFYINGNLDISQSATGLIHQGGRQIEIGGVSTGYPHYFNGLIDEVRIYNNALTQEQICADMRVVPEPASILLFGIGGLTIAGIRRLKRRR
jgi:hypothetical protein